MMIKKKGCYIPLNGTYKVRREERQGKQTKITADSLPNQQ
jgi:hypothetical protein